MGEYDLKKKLAKVFAVTMMALGFGGGQVQADTTWESKCTAYGVLKTNANPSFQHLNCLLTNAAIEADIPPEVVKAVAMQESRLYIICLYCPSK